ncbi:MAG: C-GCAxxG-C-C family protein [Bilifractor sp.]
MGKYLERAKCLRNDPALHYNCAQAVVMSFAGDEGSGISEQTARAVTANFGSGMKMASVCGAITGGLMVLGLYGIDDPASVGLFYRHFRENHDDMLDCGSLLRVNKEKGGSRKEHCDGMVYESVSLLEQMLQERGLIH